MADLSGALAASASVSTARCGIAVHYHEIGLKGRNRGFFEKRLVRNLREALGGAEVRTFTGRLFVPTQGPPSAEALEAVRRTFGVAVYAPCVVVEATIEAITEAALSLASGREASTFAVAARRATKEAPFSSRDVNVAVGSAVEQATGWRVHLDDPDVAIHVDVVAGRALVYADRLPGPGGLPVGVSGVVSVLLSGGIDSPVAAWRMLRRGTRATFAHFHSAPFTDQSSVRKTTELATMIASWQGDTTMYLVAFGNTQQQIVVSAPPALRVLLYRRFMVRVAERLALRDGATALVTGDSLGQVASQTLENLACVEDAATMPLLRPLLGFDKQEIVDTARRIGTFDTSVLPYEDCCSLFVPKSPATHASVASCRDAEKDLDVEGLVNTCVSESEVVRISRPKGN